MLGKDNPTGLDFGELTAQQMRDMIPDYSKLDAMEQEYYLLIHKAEQCSTDILATAEGFAESVADKAYVCWNERLDKAEKLLERLQGKALDYAVARMSEAYASVVNYGIRFPTIEEILTSYGDPAITGPTGPIDWPDGTPLPPAGAEPCLSDDGQTGYWVLPCIQATPDLLFCPTAMYDPVADAWVPLTDKCTSVAMTAPPIMPGGNLTSTPYDPTNPQMSAFLNPPPGTYGPGITVTNGTPTYNPGTGGPYPPGGGPPGGGPPGGGPPNPIHPGQGGGPYPPSGGPTTCPTGSSGGPGGSLTVNPCPPPPGPACPPCPPAGQPTEPKPPTVPFGMPAATPPNLQPLAAQQLDWCKFIAQWRDLLSTLGNALIKDDSYNVGLIIQYAGTGGTIPTGDMQHFLEDALQIYRNANAGHLTGPYLQSLRDMNICDVDKQLGIMAAKRFFEFVESLTLEGHKDHEWDFGGKLSAPALLKAFAFGDTTYVANIRTGYSNRGEYKAFIIPLIELCDVCLKYNCPIEIPSIGDAIETYLRGQITEEHCRCLVEINGGRWDEFKNVIAARREQLVPEELIRLWLRGKLDDKELKQRLRNSGMLTDSEQEDRKELAKEIPHISDMLRFMARNIYNPDVINRFDLDAEFDRAVGKDATQFQEWRKGLGITDEAMTAYWRAHWQVPSPGHMAELVQRNRPGRVDQSIEVTIDDYDRVLRENDWLAFWRPRMLSIAYRPLTRIDARRSYVSGAMSRADFLEAMQDIGMKPENAEIIARFADTQRRKALEAHPAMKLYEEYGLTRSEATGQLESDGYTAEEIDLAMGESDTAEKARNKAACVKNLTRQWMAGGVDETAFRTELLRIGLDQEQVERIFSQQCGERKHREKHETASTLCDWFSNGLITPDDFSSRLVTIGYDSEDAMAIIKRCNIKIQDANKKAQEKAAKAAEAAKKALEKAALAAELKRQDLLKLADSVAKINNSHSYDEANFIRLGMDTIIRDYGLSEEIAYRVAMATRDRLPKSGPILITQWIIDAGRAWPEFAPDISSGGPNPVAQITPPSGQPAGKGKGAT